MKTYKMIIIAVYKRSEDLSEEDKELLATNVNNPEEAKQKEEQAKSKNKPYVWVHPPKDLELSQYD
jgi:hypothetical protein